MNRPGGDICRGAEYPDNRTTKYLKGLSGYLGYLGYLRYKVIQYF